MKRFAALTMLGLMTAPVALHAQQADSANPETLIGSLNTLWRPVRNNLQRAAEQMPEEHYGFKPTADVRSFGQLIGHVTNTHYNFCSSAGIEARPQTPNHETLSTKAELVAALKASSEYCDRVYAAVTDQTASEIVTMFGVKRPRLLPLTFNVAHDNEHYGNIVTYMRLKGLVPPSSQPRQ